jgi:hypothetical protein
VKSTCSYARELSRFLRTPLSVVQKAIRSLERDDLIAGRTVGKRILLRLDPDYFAAAEIRALLEKFAESDVDLRSTARLRRRLRGQGKRR